MTQSKPPAHAPHPTAPASPAEKVSTGARLCAEPAFAAGVAQFNAGEYYACHETLETLWLARRPADLATEALAFAAAAPAAVAANAATADDTDAERLCLQGLIQLAVALYKWQQSNRRGALFLRERALLKWSGLPARFAGIDVAALRAAVDCTFAPLLNAAPDGHATDPQDESPMATVPHPNPLPPMPTGKNRLRVNFTAGDPA